MKTIDRHWTACGTALTNFSADELSLYRLAIKVHGDKRFVIKNKTFHPHTWKGYSLHHVSPIHDASDFWQTFREVQKGYANL